MLLAYHWPTCCCCFDEQCVLLCERCYKSFVLPGFKDLYLLHSGMDTNISHSNSSIIPILILCVISKLIAAQSPCSHKCYSFCKQLLAISISILSLPTQHWLCIITCRTSLQHVATPPTNTQHHYLLFLLLTVVVIMEKEECHGCNKWFARIEQHLMYHNHCRSVMMEHACQQRLKVKCRNCNDGSDPLIGTIVVASAPEVDDCMSTGMSTRCAKVQ
jgi:hypothetical protein